MQYTWVSGVHLPCVSLPINKLGAKTTFFLIFCHRRVATGAVYLSPFGTEITRLLISALVTHQRKMQHGFAVHTFLVHPVSGPPNDTQGSMDFLFIPDTRSGWASCHHRDSAWISCPLFLRTPVVGSPISPGDSRAVCFLGTPVVGLPIRPGLSIDSMLTVSVPVFDPLVS